MAESEEALQLKRRARRRLIGAIALMCFVVIILPLLLDKEPGPAGPPLDVQIPKQDPGGGIGARIGPAAVQPPASVAPVPEKKVDATPAQATPSAPDAEAAAGKSAAPATKTASPAAKTEPSAAKAAPAKAEAAKIESAKTESKKAQAGKAEPAKPESVAGKTAADPASAADKDEQERAQAALRDEAWVVSLDAFSDVKNVKLLRSKLSAAGVKSYAEPVKTSKGELTRVRAGPFASKEAAEKARAKLEAMGLKPGAVASR